jgi:hypothetical protein
MRKRKKPLNPYIKELLHIKKKKTKTDRWTDRKKKKNTTRDIQKRRLQVLQVYSKPQCDTISLGSILQTTLNTQSITNALI